MCGSWGSSPGGTISVSSSCAPLRASAGSSCPCPVSTMPATRPAPSRPPSSSGSTPSTPVAALARFAGVARRFEFRGDFGGVTFVDDYAHLPGEVRAALDAALCGGFGRVVCVFQPHRYSRIALLAPGFADSFEGADLVVVTDVYPAGEMPRPGVSGKLVLDAIVRAHPQAPVRYVPNHEAVVAYLRENLRPGDLCLTLAAGDLTNLASELAAGLEGGESP